MIIEMRVVFKGEVQGVGFRATLQRHARALHVAGRARNLGNGDVEAIFQGEREVIERLLKTVYKQPGRGRIDTLSREERPIQTLAQDFNY